MTVKMNSVLAVAAMLLLVTVCGATAADPCDGLVAYWGFDEGEGDIAYDSAGDNDGTIYGAQRTTGVLDGALGFNGVGDYVEVPYDDSLAITDEITIGAWVNIANAAAGTGQHYVIDSRDVGGGGYGLNVDTERIQFWIAGTWYRNFPSTISIDNWHYVVGTYDGSNMIVYVDGAEIDRYSVATSIIPGSSSLFIGQRYTYIETFQGIIDEVAIYNRALSADEVLQLYEEGLDPYEFAIAGILDAIAQKEQLLLDLDAAIEREQAAYDALEELLAGGDYGDLPKGDIIKGQQKIHSAIQHEQQSKDALEKSIEKLYDALYALAWEPPVADEPMSEL